MADILEDAPLIVRKFKTLAPQPMNGEYELRHYLYQHSWHVDDEALVVADDRIYTVIRAEKDCRKIPDPLMLEIGLVLWEKKPELLRHHIESLIFVTRRAVVGIEKSERVKKSVKYKKMKERIKALKKSFYAAGKMKILFAKNIIRGTTGMVSQRMKFLNIEKVASQATFLIVRTFIMKSAQENDRFHESPKEHSCNAE